MVVVEGEGLQQQRWCSLCWAADSNRRRTAGRQEEVEGGWGCLRDGGTGWLRGAEGYAG